MGVSQHGLDVRLPCADRLARATDLDMVLGLAPDRRQLSRPRDQAADHRGGARGRWRAGGAQLIDHLKKGDMATEAERLLAETGWLPELLRMVDPDADAGGDTGGG